VTLEDRLERLAHRTPPGDPADVLAAARRRTEAARGQRANSRTLLVAAAAVFAVVALGAGALALVSGDGRDTVTVAGPDSNPAQSVPCEDITRFAGSLSDTGIVYDHQASSSPSDLVSRSDAVLRGALTGNVSEVTDEEYREDYVGFEVAVREHFKTDGDQAPDTVTVLLPTSKEQPPGHWAEIARSAAGAPVVVFASARPGSVHTDGPAVIANPVEGIVTACDDSEPIGLVGTQGEWPSYRTLAEVEAAITDGFGTDEEPIDARTKDCGTFVAAAYGQGPEVEGFRCAAAAFAGGQRARLRVTALTEEGDPVTFTYETDEGTVLVTEDHSEDRFSDRGIGQRICRTWNLDIEHGELNPQDCEEVPPAPGPSPGGAAVVWPNHATSADRSTAEAAVRSFLSEVVGVQPDEVSPDRSAADNGPVWVTVDLGTAEASVLVVPVADGWVVMQVGGGASSVSASPRRLHLPAVDGAETVEIHLDTAAGTETIEVSADALDDGVEVPSGALRSVVAAYFDRRGNVVSLAGGHY